MHKKCIQIQNHILTKEQLLGTCDVYEELVNRQGSKPLAMKEGAKRKVFIAGVPLGTEKTGLNVKFGKR